ncbi:O-methyltransferase-domain-containing protein, partial [Clohesyomyces aquaticus]
MTVDIQNETEKTLANDATEAYDYQTKNGVLVPEITPAVDIGFALRASNLGAVPETLKAILSFGQSPSVDNESARLQLLAKARDLVRALETPRETMIKHCWAQPACFTAITCCYRLGVFSVLVADGGKPRKVTEIASILKTSPEILARLMKHMAAMGYIEEVGVDEYAPTNFSKSLTIPIIGDGYPCLAGGAHESCSKFPEYMAKTNYATPNNSANGPYQYAFSTKMNMFEYMQAHQPLGKQFNHHMGGYAQGRPSWLDPGFYPVEERLVKGMESSPNAVLLVDVGGSLGHDIQQFKSKHPEASGRLVVEDLPVVIDAITELDPSIERVEHDFHTEQPIKGARAYYMHSVLHDWPDEVCKSILKQLVAAMKPGYSKLLINENIIPDTGADWQATALDIMMLTLFSSKERTKADWYRLLESPEFGLKITGIWSVE